MKSGVGDCCAPAGTERTTWPLPCAVPLVDTRSRFASAAGTATVSWTPPAGAAVARLTETCSSRSRPIVWLAKLMPGGCVTLMVAVVEVTPVPVACSVVFWPAVTPVTAAWAESWPAGMVTGETTRAMLVFAVASASVRPLLGAAAAMFTVMLFVAPATTLSVVGVTSCSPTRWRHGCRERSRWPSH